MCKTIFESNLRCLRRSFAKAGLKFRQLRSNATFSFLFALASRLNKENDMNWDQIAGNWKQFEGKVQQQSGKLTNDDLQQVRGDQKMLAGKIQERYGLSKEEAERQVRDWSGGL
jgi:uncharacterized protein YjbJ (UPF0337 family)